MSHATDKSFCVLCGIFLVSVILPVTEALLSPLRVEHGEIIFAIGELCDEDIVEDVIF